MTVGDCKVISASLSERGGRHTLQGRLVLSTVETRYNAVVGVHKMMTALYTVPRCNEVKFSGAIAADDEIHSNRCIDF